MKNIILGSVFASLAMFVWGFVFWATPISHGVSQQISLSEEAAIASALSGAITEDGAYILPGFNNGTDENFAARMLAGPVAMVHFRAAGAQPMDPMLMLKGYLHMLVSAFILALVLHSVKEKVTGYGAKVKLVVLFGLAAAVFANLGQPIWFYQSWTHHLYLAGYDFVAWLAAGLVLARFIRARYRMS